ncbi:MAG: hypothetical protein K6E80_03695 [Schwartzia sp.]|uniref:hypothetical protein n=1 Tax=Schwartzia succinivorans TaxID=55507 RepID=UPI0023563641|nr:hypothetical protein [Schwartzia succinivorans]MBE6097388.1 hypothetical protein [Schwartzia succinivorans]MCR5446699.1 hypothetical protein [Schwartzia sp. (in: firmicutes)]
MVGTGNGAVKVILGFDDSKPEFIAETTSKAHDSYHERHAIEMGLNLKQWKKAAADLLNDVEKEQYLDWYEPGRGVFRRYDVVSKRLAAGTEEGTINTYFIMSAAKLKFYLPNEYLELFNK